MAATIKRQRAAALARIQSIREVTQLCARPKSAENIIKLLTFVKTLNRESVLLWRQEIAELLIDEWFPHPHLINKLSWSKRCAFLSVLGFIMCPVNNRAQYDDLSGDLACLTSGSDAIQASIDWASMSYKSSVLDIRNPLTIAYAIICNGIDQLILTTAPNTRIALSLIAKDKDRTAAIWYDAIPNHIKLATSSMAGGLLHQSGTLHLISQGHNFTHSRQELALARKKQNGIYCYGDLAKSPALLPSEIKGMRSFVSAYECRYLEGAYHKDLTTGSQHLSQRICRSVGLNAGKSTASIGRKSKMP
jgi:hypothetical protein